MRLRVDPLKDAAGSPFGKADRLYLYLHDQKLYVEWGMLIKAHCTVNELLDVGQNCALEVA